MGALEPKIFVNSKNTRYFILRVCYNSYRKGGIKKMDKPKNNLVVSNWFNKTWEGDCLELMAEMPPSSVDLVLSDPPYGTTKNKWDSVIPLPDMWEAYKRILKPNGAVVLTAAQPFSSQLVVSNLAWFRYEWIWSKTVGSGQLNIRHRPLNTHEVVLVFSPKKPPYHPQMTTGTPYKASRKTETWTGRGYNNQRDHEVTNAGTRHPKSVLLVPNPRIKGGHPTQKPVSLFEYLILTYTLENDIVLDNTIGSGTTGVAAVNTNRNFIGMEKDKKFVDIANQRVLEAKQLKEQL